MPRRSQSHTTAPAHSTSSGFGISFAILLAGACSSDKEPAPVTPSPICSTNCEQLPGADGGSLDAPPVASELTVTLEQPEITIAQGKSVDVGVNIARPAGFVETLNLDITDLPPGASVTKLAVPYTAARGSVRLTMGNSSPQGAHLAKVVLAGDTKTVSAQLAITIVGAPGGIDTTFGPQGSGGRGTADTNAAVTDMAVQGSGKIIVAGFSGTTPNRDFRVGRFNADGTFDKTFGTEGVTTFDYGADEVAQDVLVQPDDKVVVVGYSSASASTTVIVARTLPDGAPDTTFGGNSNGKLVLNPATHTAGTGVERQSDGKLVLSVWQHNGTDYDHALIRVTESGGADSSFGSSAGYKLDTGQQDYPLALAMDAQGRFVIGGERYNGTTYDWVAARFDTSGKIENTNTFGVDKGWVNSLAGDSVVSAYATDVLVQGDGKILMAGTGPGVGGSDFVVLRYNADGTPDATFGTAGVGKYHRGSGDSSRRLAVDGQGRILFVGHTGGAGSQAVVGRVLADGQLDPSFGQNGIAVLDFTTTGADYAMNLEPLGDGRILVAGYTAEPSANVPWIVRIWP